MNQELMTLDFWQDTVIRDSQQNAAVLLYGYTKAPGTNRKGLYCGQCSEICGVRHKSRNQFFTVRRSSEIC